MSQKIDIIIDFFLNKVNFKLIPKSSLDSKVELVRSRLSFVQNCLSEQGSYIEASCHIVGAYNVKTLSPGKWLICTRLFLS